MSSNNPNTPSTSPRSGDDLALPVIEVHNLVKEYRLGALDGLRTIGRRMLGRAVPPRQQFRAIDDVSMTIRRGEVVGIIGHNGAGKSTLLKLLCGITKPTSGTVNVHGRIAPLIEVGAGLIGDMTGRENIYLNATILGLTRAEIESKVEEIIAFAELEKFIDTPIKRYSSGMQVRLGFSIATAAVPDVLIVDEVLAVGDVSFQRKCIDRMESVKDDPTKTLIIVGHNIRQLERICSRMIVLQSGAIVLDGGATDVSRDFYRLMLSREQKSEQTTSIHAGDDCEAVVQDASIGTEIGSCQEVSGIKIVETCEPLMVELKLMVNESIKDAEINIGFHNTEMVFVSKASTRTTGAVLNLEKGEQVLRFRIQDFNLTPGPYGLGIGIYDRYRRSIWTTTGFRWIDVNLSKRSFVDMPLGSLTYSLASWELEK